MGPVTDGGWRGSVAFNVETCAVHVATVDLDAGAYARDVRLARIWDGQKWQWADDWTLRGGRVERPGRRPVAEGELAEALEVDAQGRVIARSLDGRRVQILRGDDGSFRGMREGALSVQLTDEGDGVSGTRSIRYERTGSRIDAVDGPNGRVRYGYDGPALRTILWADSAAVRLDTSGTSGLGGTWRCDLSGETTQVERGRDLRWTIAHPPGTLEVTGPGGDRVSTRWSGSRLLGWTDPGGVRVQVTHDESGRITDVKQGGDSVLALEWGRDGLAALRDVNGGWWRLTRGQQGIEMRSEPDARAVHREVVGGRVRLVETGAESTMVGWDAEGRPATVRAGSLGAVRLERDAEGALVRVLDGTGAQWRIEREASSRPTRIIDPSGTRWELKTDAAGRLDWLVGPDGERRNMVRSLGRLSQVLTGGVRWTWLRDAHGLLAGIRDPEGRLTGLARDQAGRLVSIRSPDGTSLSLGRDAQGRLRSVGTWRLSRDAHGRILEVRGADGAVAGWSRDRSGRVSGFGMGALTFEITRDGAGRIQSLRGGESAEARWRIDRDGAGRVGAVSAPDGGTTSVLRDSAGRVTRLTDDFGALTLTRDLRGRISRVSAGHTWVVGRDAVGRVVRVEVDDLGVVGADYEPDGQLKLTRLPDGALVRRNTSDDAGELLAVNKEGEPIGSAGWTLDASGRLVGLDAGGPIDHDLDEAGRLVRTLGPSGEWSRELGMLSAPDGSRIKLDETGRPLAVTLTSAGPWGLMPGNATYRWDTAGRLTGLDGEAGGAVLIHDALGRITMLMLGERATRLRWDGFGRLRKAGADLLVGWDAVLEVGGAPRAPITADVVARPGGAVFADPRGYPLFVPWSGALRPWPSGWMPGVEASEFGAASRYVLPGGVLVDLHGAVDPLSGAATTPDRWPWTPQNPELSRGASPFRAPDATSETWWDAAPFDAANGWNDAGAALCAGGFLPGGLPEPTEAPGLPWLPASFARVVPAPVSGLGGVVLDEDTAARLVLRAALGDDPLDTDTLLRGFLGSELAADALDVPGFRLPEPAFLTAGVAYAPFGH